MVSAISIRSVSKAFGSLQAVSDLSLEIQQGEFFGLLGPNGAGKTTLISMLAGLTRPDQGTLSIMGHDVVTDYKAARKNLGVVPQELVFDPFFNVRESLQFQSGYYGVAGNEEWIDELLVNLDLADKRTASLRSLSGGMKRRFLIAQALVHRPPVIVLDEPTAGVDVELRQSLWQFIVRLNKAGHTIVLTTHYLEEAETLCTKLAMMRNGQIVALDNTKDLLACYGGLKVRIESTASTVPPTFEAWKVEQDGPFWMFDINDYTEVESILAAFRHANLPVISMNIMEPDLENVFLHLMR